MLRTENDAKVYKGSALSYPSFNNGWMNLNVNEPTCLEVDPCEPCIITTTTNDNVYEIAKNVGIPEDSVNIK